MNRNTKISLAVNGVVLFLVMTVLISTYKSNKYGSGGDLHKDEIDVDILFSSSRLDIVNNENFDLKNCLIRLNDDYTYKIGDLEANSDEKISMFMFVDKNGVRFDPLAMVPVNASIVCEQGNSYFRNKGVEE